MSDPLKALAKEMARLRWRVIQTARQRDEARAALSELHAEAHGDPCGWVRCWVTAYEEEPDHG